MEPYINKIIHGDCLEILKEIPSDSVDLAVIDPPYNIGKAEWDSWTRVTKYVEFMGEVAKELERVLKPTGSFYIFHNDFDQVTELHTWVINNTAFKRKNFIVWNKRYTGSRRKQYFDNVLKRENVRRYRQLTEYILFYTLQHGTGLTDIVNHNRKLGSIRQYLQQERERAGLRTMKQINELLGTATSGGGKASNIFGKRTTTKAWEFPTKALYEKLQTTGFFRRPYDELRKEYDSIKTANMCNRYTFNNLKQYHDVWEFEVASKAGHVTPKPVQLIENIILHSSSPGDIVLDCFGGSGTTAIAARNTGRRFILIEKEEDYIQLSEDRLRKEG